MKNDRRFKHIWDVNYDPSELQDMLAKLRMAKETCFHLSTMEDGEILDMSDMFHGMTVILDEAIPMMDDVVGFYERYRGKSPLMEDMVKKELGIKVELLKSVQ
jgi:hypothetical protein